MRPVANIRNLHVVLDGDGAVVGHGTAATSSLVLGYTDAPVGRARVGPERPFGLGSDNRLQQRKAEKQNQRADKNLFHNLFSLPTV